MAYALLCMFVHMHTHFVPCLGIGCTLSLRNSFLFFLFVLPFPCFCVLYTGGFSPLLLSLFCPSSLSLFFCFVPLLAYPLLLPTASHLVVVILVVIVLFLAYAWQ